MNAPLRNPLTNQDEIIIDWIALSAPLNGDSPITSYNLQLLDNGNWVDLYGVYPGGTLTQFILTNNVVRAEWYIFRLRAENIFGWSKWSKQTSIKAAGIPYKVNPV